MNLKQFKRELSKVLGVNLFENSKIDELLDKLALVDKDEEAEAVESEDKAVEAEAEDVATENADVATENAESEDIKAEDVEEKEPKPTEAAKSKQEEKPTETEPKAKESKQADNELFKAKLEAKLLRAGVREDKLESAIKLFMSDNTIDDIESVSEFAQDFPEWQAKVEVEKVGMEVGGSGDGLSAEERRLAELGII